MQTGFQSQAMRAGISISVQDMLMPPEKKEFLDKAYQQVREIENQYVEGLITDGERYNKVIDIWAQTSGADRPAMMKRLSSDLQGPRAKDKKARKSRVRHSTPSS